MSRGLYGLATVAAAAPFLGILLTLWGILNSFPGCGCEQWGYFAVVTNRLSESIVPSAFALATAIVAFSGYHGLKAQVAGFQAEMQSAILELRGCLEDRCRPR